jgi:hypothetical protein
MTSEWHIDIGRLERYAKLSPKKKLEWLGEMHDLMRRTYTKERRRIFWKLRGIK